MAPRRDAYEAQHAKNRLLYEKEIRQIFTKVCYECGMSVTQLASIVEQAGKDVKFAQIPAVRKVLDKLQRRLAERLKTTVENGVKAEWKLANDKYDALIGSMAGGDYFERMDEQMRLKTMARNMEALNAFLIRKEEGLNLSQRVWKYSGQMRDAMEVALELGISEGQSAAEIARDLKQYLNYPDKLFRRVRDEETGELKISKPASVFHPGQGVYRSSYKNALRLALNETNIAYRKSDSIRRQGLDFVVGIEIHLSNNHNCKGVPEGEFFDICDELKGKYPPDFEFVGWHPNCYSDDSEVLTNRGWLLFRDVLPNDWVLSLNPDTRSSEWTAIVAMQSYRYAGRMVRFHNRSLDCLVTPEHRMVYLNKADGRIKYCEAAEYTKGRGGFYRGCEYSAEDINTITIGNTTYNFDAFCRFIGYWLADGACFNTSGITISQNDGEAAKPNIIEAVKALGYEPTVYPNSVRFYHSAFVRYLRRFGHCKDKYIPDEIKRASRRQIALFLDAFAECDGSIRPPKDFVGNRGTHFHSERGERVFFTTSRRMAGDLCELILKAGGRPSVREREPGAATKKDGTVIRSNYTCFVISDLKAVTATVFDKEFVDYDGMVYDLTLEKNHIMYIKRKGRCFWGSNCRCWTSAIVQTEEEYFRDSDGIYRGSVNEVKDVPPQFKEWLAKNQGRIEAAEGRGTLPYFLRDNQWAWKEDAERPYERKEKTALAKAEERHAARTEEEVQAIKDRWAMRQRAMRNADRVMRLVDAVPGMREYLAEDDKEALSVLTGESPLKGNYYKLLAASKLIMSSMRHLRSELDVIDKPWEAMKEHGVQKILEANDAVQKKMAQWENQPLAYQLKKLRFEADWIEKNKKGVLSTWEVARDAYLKAAARVEWEIEWKPIVDEIDSLALNPFADPDMIAEARSYVGNDKAAAQIAIDSIKFDIEMNQLRDEYEKYLKEAPGAFTESLQNDMEHALDGEDIEDARIWIQTARTVIKFYRDYRDEIIDLTPKVQDQKVMQALAEALAKQELAVMSEAIRLAKREINFQSLVAQARDILTDHRDLLAKLKPQVITWLEERSVPKDYSVEDIVKLKSAIDNAQWEMDEWQKKIDKYTELWQYYIKENVKLKEYGNLIMELRQAVLDIDVAKVDALIPKVEEQKKKHEDEKAYREGVRAEWEKMKDEIYAIRAKINKDLSGYFSKDGGHEIVSLIADFEINEGGPRKLREGRKQYKEILDLAAKLGIEIVTGEVYTDNGVTFGPGMKVNKFADSSFTQERKDKARWYKTKSACLHNYGPVADKYIKNASQEELDAQYDYTRGSGFMNRPLRGYNGSWYNFEGIGKVSLNNETGTGADEIKAFTQFLDRCTYDFDVWVQRGIETDSGLKGFLGIDSLDDDKVNAMVGQTVCDMGFISCGSSKGTGFHGHILNIYCPKGTKLLYVENHSAFGGGSENETIIQRNTHFRITKVEKSGYRWYIDVEVVAQI